MNPFLLTKSSQFLLGPIASLLGYLMNGIFWVLDKIGIPNIGLAIILFTLVIYMLLMPLTIQQQKFSKLSNIMNPELQAIQKKYKNRKDQASLQKMNEETQLVYKKYGVSPTGSCLQMAIQLPILFALYQVIYNIPAYVTKVYSAFTPLVTKLAATKGAAEYLQATKAGTQFAKHFTSANFTGNVGNTVANTFIDVLNRFSTSEWSDLSAKFPDLSNLITNAQHTGTQDLLEKYNFFLGLNIGNSPWYALQQAVKTASVIGVIAAIAVPLLAAVTQLINVALMPQPQTSGNDQASQMANSMKTMNYIMPVMSAWFCFTLPAGMGLYWIAGSVIRSIQQVAINKSINKMDMDEYIRRNVEKARKKEERRGGKPTVTERLLKENAAINTKNVNPSSKAASVSDAEKQKQLENAKKYYENGKFRSGSLASKANMVSQFNDAKKNDKK